MSTTKTKDKLKEASIEEKIEIIRKFLLRAPKQSGIEEIEKEAYIKFSYLNPQAYIGDVYAQKRLSQLIKLSARCYPAYIALRRLSAEWYESKKEPPPELCKWTYRHIQGNIPCPNKKNRYQHKLRKISFFQAVKLLVDTDTPVTSRNSSKKDTAAYIVREAATKAGFNYITEATIIDSYKEINKAQKK